MTQEAVHQGLKPHVCRSSGCEKRFAERWNRKKHENRAHNLFLDTTDQVPEHRRSGTSASASATVFVPGAGASTSIQPDAGKNPAGPPSTPRPRQRRSLNTIERVTPRTPLVSSSHAHSRRSVSPPTEPVTPHASVPRTRSRPDMDSAMNLLELGKSSGSRRDTHNGSGTKAGSAGQDAAALFQSVNQNGIASISPLRGRSYGSPRGDSNRRRGDFKRSKSAGPVTRKLGFLWGRTGSDDSESEKTESSRHSRLRKIPK